MCQLVIGTIKENIVLNDYWTQRDFLRKEEEVVQNVLELSELNL